ncbi:MAG: hypothetical protein AAF939_10830 [Planctomycetota bacterium]
MKYRNCQENRLGYLRKAILEDWTEPKEARVKTKEFRLREKEQWL